VTGAEDGTVVIWSMNSLSAVKKFECTEEEHELTVSVPPTIPSALLPPGPSPVTHIMVLCEVRVTPSLPPSLPTHLPISLPCSLPTFVSFSLLLYLPPPLLHSTTHKVY